MRHRGRAVEAERAGIDAVALRQGRRRVRGHGASRGEWRAVGDKLYQVVGFVGLGAVGGGWWVVVVLWWVSIGPWIVGVGKRVMEFRRQAGCEVRVLGWCISFVLFTRWP